MKTKLAHIINPYRAPAGSEHFIAQPITLRSIELAAKHNTTELEIELFAAIFHGDEDLVPAGFKIVYLKTSLQEIANFENARRLPLISDILNLLKTNSTAEYYIYSNNDIGLQPHFYTAVCKQLHLGHDAIIINRRGISDRFTKLEQLPEIYKEEGNDHPGYDCFVFKNNLIDKFNFKNICVGLPRFERVFVLNLIAYSNKILFLEQEHLTFHIGQIIYKKWGDKNHLNHNEAEYKKIRKELISDLRIINFPYWDNFIFKRYWKWLWNPNFSLPDNLLLEWRYRLTGR